MHAVVYHGPGDKRWEQVPDPKIIDDTDAVVRIDAVTGLASRAGHASPLCMWPSGAEVCKACALRAKGRHEPVECTRR